MEKEKMIDIQELGELFSKHVASCKSCSIVCNRNAAFESWFRVELIQVLNDMGYTDVLTNYKYIDTDNKADLAININAINIVFELKSFVKDQDSNKKKEYPKQISRLKNLLIDTHKVIQVITFTTFINYTEEAIKKIIDNIFDKDEWRMYGPVKLHKDYELMILLTEKTYFI